MKDYTKKELEEIDTKGLLTILNDVRARKHRNEATVKTYTREVELDGVYIDRIKMELSTRPHLPNKQEAKELRKQKLKEKRNK